MTNTKNEYSFYMQVAIEEAETAAQEGEIPVGAVIVKNGEIIARTHNTVVASNDPTAHAEVLAIRKASEVLNSWRLSGCTMFVTLEPCAMCAGACVFSRLDMVVFGAFEGTLGCCHSVFDLLDGAFFHTVRCVGGIMESECAALMKNCFSTKRKAQVFEPEPFRRL